MPPADADPDPRIRRTCSRIHERLGGAGPLLFRYPHAQDRLPGGEGAFAICSFWGVECLALQGDLDGAAATFEAICRYANDVGLFGEEYRPGRTAPPSTTSPRRSRTSA